MWLLWLLRINPYYNERFGNKLYKHQTINCCHYELAVSELKSKLEMNKWLSLVRLSKEYF